jgi:hypothetical protein
MFSNGSPWFPSPMSMANVCEKGGKLVVAQPAYDDIALLHVSAKDWDKLVARAAVLRQRNARKGE